MRKGCSPLTKVHPLIPAELAEIRDVAHLTKRGEMWVLALQLEERLGSEVENLSSSLSAVVPQAKGRMRLLQIFAYPLLQQSNIELSSIGVLRSLLQQPQGRSDLVAKVAHLFRFLRAVGITNESVRRSNLFDKHSLGFGNL